MPEHSTEHVKGKITHVFGHRFVVATDSGSVLADVTPKGLDQYVLRIGDHVELEGEMKPTELKVMRLTVGETSITIEHKKPHHEHHDAKPDDALKSARDAGFEPIGDPRRKPKHFEVLGRRNNKLTELHIELSGHIRKMKDVEVGDHKWRDAIAS
jgi:hypothetical protein